MWYEFGVCFIPLHVDSQLTQHHLLSFRSLIWFNSHNSFMRSLLSLSTHLMDLRKCYLFERPGGERGRERNRERERNMQEWALLSAGSLPKPRQWPRAEGQSLEPGTQPKSPAWVTWIAWLELSHARVHVSRKLDSRTKPSLEPRHSMWTSQLLA